jgi:hypothetical protein
MKSVSLCHAAADRPFARELAAYIEQNLPLVVSCDDALVGPDLDILDATERALSAEVAMVLISPASMPKQPERDRWMNVFIEQPKELLTHLGFVLVSDCRFPQLLRRERFFDASSDALTAFREVKRWLLRPNEYGGSVAPPSSDLDELRRTLTDRPGIADVDSATATRFAKQCALDFEAVYRLDCRGLSAAGVQAEMEAVAEPDQDRRVLFVLAGAEPNSKTTRASIIFTPELDWAMPNPVSDALRAFQTERTLEAGWRAVKLLNEARRLVEALELLDSMFAIADVLSIARIEREQYWIRADLDLDVRHLDTISGGQLAFDFTNS